MGFAENLNKLCQRAGNKAELLVRGAALELQSGMIGGSPVDEGRFKGNWQCGIGAINADTSQPPDKGGDTALGRTRVVLEGWKPGQTIFLTNSMPYARRLENGWSQQAPSGMVRLTVQRYGESVKKAAESVK